MELKNFLSEKRTVILKKWFDLILDTYPAETARFLLNEKDPFANPVGSTIHEGLEGIYKEFLHDHDIDSDNVSPFLDSIIRIRAIQDFAPSQAIAFLFPLKKIIREELKSDMQRDLISDELLILDSKIDALALLAFDIYMKCREKIYELKANELRNWTFHLLKRAAKAGKIQGESISKD